MSSTAKAPTDTLFLEGQALQVYEDNTIIGSKSPPISVERAWVVQYIDLDKIDKQNLALAYKGVKWDLAVILYRLAKQENGLRNTCKVDVNGLPSCGLFHFQQLTYESRCNAYDFGENMDKPTQVKCAIDMIMSGEGHTYRGWYNSWKTLNLPII